MDFQLVYHADIRCYWCGHDSGTVSSDTPMSQPGAPIAFNSRSGDTRVVRSVGEIRCDRCHGPVFSENPEKRRVYPHFVFRQRRPRRPKVA